MRKSGLPEETIRRLRLHGRTGRRLGSDSFIARLEKLLARRLRPGKRGRPRKGKKIKEHTVP